MPLHGNLRVEGLVNGPFQENCYLLGDETSRVGILIDPGDEEQRILAWVAKWGGHIEKIVNTHAHLDHVGAIAAIRRELAIPFYLHPAERPILMALPWTCQMFGLPEKEIPHVDYDINDGDRIVIGNITGEVILTPGHSPGGCCFYFATEKVLIAGDTLFAGSIGRTDLPGGDMPTLLRSIRERLLPLPDNVAVYCGHGPPTTMGRERHANPFLQNSEP